MKTIGNGRPLYEPSVAVYNDLFRQINGPSHLFEQAFREMFAKEHPTLQQAFVRNCLIPALEVLAAERPDARNQGSHNFAVEALKIDHHLPLI